MTSPDPRSPDPVERGPGARARRRAVIGAWGRLAVHYGTQLPPENQEA